VPDFRIREAAELLGVSDDTFRRWADSGRIPTTTDTHGRRIVVGAELARFAQDLAATTPHATETNAPSASARNRIIGLVLSVRRDAVMAQVEIQAGPYRVVSLLSREAADELGLEPGVLAVARIKSTDVVIEVPKR
jgi:molybdopterin-binding protein